MKLKESIPSNSVKIIELYNKIEHGALDTSPAIQRKLVWKKHHKYAFIETILMNLPFPEVYIASAEMDVEKLQSKEIVVDGKQRLTSICDYIKGKNDFQNQKKIKPFEDLSTDEKRDFLNYLVTVKDLKDINPDLIKEIFKRINSTEYSLNAVEKTNAVYGDGEFFIFCKQVVYSDYEPTSDETDIVLIPNVKNELNSFFLENDIFNDNDKSRMFDVQYIMLIVSTFLEGDYYIRSLKISDYLEKYNDSFTTYERPLNLLLKSIRAIKKLGLSKLSYWFNKANLFTLIIELSKVNTEHLDSQKLELLLLDLENKVDIYFSDGDSANITEEEKKYFEVARQGSHEKAARIHRGKVISGLINNALNTVPVNSGLSLVQSRIELLTQKGILFTTIQPTETGLKKFIMDSTSPIREFLKVNKLHDYSIQDNGPQNKVHIPAKYILENEVEDLTISLYKANHRGDARIWLKQLDKFAKPNDLIAIILKNAQVYILNITQLEIETLEGNSNPFNDIVLKK